MLQQPACAERHFIRKLERKVEGGHQILRAHDLCPVLQVLARAVDVGGETGGVQHPARCVPSKKRVDAQGGPEQLGRVMRAAQKPVASLFAVEGDVGHDGVAHARHRENVFHMLLRILGVEPTTNGSQVFRLDLGVQAERLEAREHASTCFAHRSVSNEKFGPHEVCLRPQRQAAGKSQHVIRICGGRVHL